MVPFSLNNVSMLVYVSSCVKWEPRAYNLLCIDLPNSGLMKMAVSDSFTSKESLDKKGSVNVPGYHKKNQIEYQKDIDRFVQYVSFNLHILLK